MAPDFSFPMFTQRYTYPLTPIATIVDEKDRILACVNLLKITAIIQGEETWELYVEGLPRCLCLTSKQVKALINNLNNHGKPQTL